MSSFGAVAPAGAATESFQLTSASQPGQSSITWQGAPVNPPGTPNVFPSTVSLSGQIDSITGDISAATLSLPDLPQPEQQGQNPNFAFSEVHPGTASGNFNATTGAVTIDDSLTITFTVEPVGITCVSTPINVALSGTWDSTTENVTLATTSSFTIPDFVPGNSSCALASPDLNASPGGTAGSVGNSMSLALNGKFAPGLPTTTTLAASPDSPSLAGTSVTLTSTVTDPSSQGTPTGTVTFLDNGASIGTGTLDDSGTATLSTTALPGGTNQLTASYGGDSNYSGSVSGSQSYTIQPKPSVSANLPNQVIVGADPVPLTLSVANPASGNDWSTMYLQIALRGLGTGQAVLSYKDSGGNFCPLTFTGTTAYFSGTGAAPCGTPPASFSLDAGSTLTVPLYVSYPSGAKLGTQTVTATLYTGSCTSPTSCTATAPLSGSAAPTSSGTYIVAPASRVALGALTGSVIYPSDGNVPQGFEVEVQATFTKPHSMPTPSGTVAFSIDNGPVLDTETVDDTTSYGNLSTPTTLTPGTHTIDISYSGDATYLPDSTTTTFTSVPAVQGVAFACNWSVPGVAILSGNFAAGLVVQADPVPANVAPDSTYTMTGIDVTMNADAAGFFDPTGAGTAQVSATLDSGQTITGPDQDLTFTQSGDAYTGTISGLTATLPTGDPGTTTTAAITDFQFQISGDSITVIWDCTQASLPLPPVTASGTTLAVTPDSSATPGAPVTMTATIYPTPTSATGGGQVDFYDGTTDLATVPVDTSGDAANGTASFTTAILSTGVHQLTAVWSGNLQVPESTSNTVDYQVGSDSMTTLASSANPANAAQPVTFTATVNGADGGPQPTGNVSFTSDGNPITGCASQPLSTDTPPTATCKTSFGPGETHSIVATYSGDGTYVGSTSDPLSQSTLPGTNTTILSTKDPSPPGNVTFWAGVSPASGTGATPTGTVAFTIDGSLYRPCNAARLGPGAGASCTVSFKAGTTHKVFATYAGSSTYSGSMSNKITQTVTGSKSSTTPKDTNGSATLGSGKALNPGQSISIGAYRLVMQTDGNLVEYQGSKARWASGTSGHPRTGVVMQRDGNLVEYNGGHALWASNTSGHPGAFLALQGSDGNVVIYGPGGQALWATGT